MGTKMDADKFPTDEELAETYRTLVENPGLVHYRNRSTRNSSGETDDRKVNEFMASEDASRLVRKFKQRLLAEKEQ